MSQLPLSFSSYPRVVVVVNLLSYTLNRLMVHVPYADAIWGLVALRSLENMMMDSVRWLRLQSCVADRTTSMQRIPLTSFFLKQVRQPSSLSTRNSAHFTTIHSSRMSCSHGCEAHVVVLMLAGVISSWSFELSILSPGTALHPLAHSTIVCATGGS